MKLLHYLDTLKSGGNQAAALLSTSTSSQIKKLQKMAEKVLAGKIPLSSNAKSKLKSSAKFIRKLGDKNQI